MKYVALIFFMVCVQGHAQKYVDLTAQLSNINHGMVINGNDFSLTEQVIINTDEINFKKPAYLRFYNVLINVNGAIKGAGKFNLLQGSRIYVKNKDENTPNSKLSSRKPFGEDVTLSKCKLFKKEKKGTKYTLWHTNGRKYKSGTIGDGTVVKRMFYTVKIGKKYLDKQLLSD